MKLKSLMSAAVTTGLLTLASAPAHAVIVEDAWQLDLGGGFITTNIGHLNMAGGGATVKQEVGVGGVFVGAKFTEFGAIFSLSYTPDNVVGAGDFGGPALLNIPGFLGGNKLDIIFSGLTGSVTTIGPGNAFGSKFDPGVGSITLALVNSANVILAPLAGLMLVDPSNGGFNNAIGVAGSTGGSTILSLVLGDLPDLFRESDGTSLESYVSGVNAPGLLFNLITQNTITSASGLGACPFALEAAGIGCITAAVASDGTADLLRIPEPGTLLLLGIGLAGLGFGASRRKQVAA